MENSQQNIGWYFSIPERYRFGFILGALLTLCAFFAFSPSPASALTTVPTKMNFQGRLTDSVGNVKPNGTYNMRLRLYTVNSGGSAVWTEDRLVSAGNGVTVTNGLFSIQLGSVTSLPASLFASGALYLEVELPTPASATGTSPVWTEGAMTPRNQMATSAYAYNSETLDGLDSTAFGQVDSQNNWSTDQFFTYLEAADGAYFGNVVSVYAANTSAFSISGPSGNLFTADTTNSRVRIGSTTADATGVVLVLDTKNTSGDPTGIVGATYYNSNMGKFRCYQVSSWKNCDDGGNSTTIDGLDSTAFGLLTGSNTWSGVNTFTNNANFDSGTLFVNSANNRVGIGTSSPNAALNILGQGNYAATNTPSYSCDPGGSYNGDGTCNYTYQNGSPPCAPYEYDGGDGFCYENVTLPANVTNNYSCPSGGTLSGTTCIVTGALLNIETTTASLFTVDSAGTVRVGAATADATGVVLILDTKNTAGDPTGVDGAMYYNSSAGKFRCYQGVWSDCISGQYIPLTMLSSTHTDAQTIYFGNAAVGLDTTPGTRKIYFPKAGTIKMAKVWTSASIAGSGEAWSMYVRKNNTTDTLIQTVSSATSERAWTNNSMNISIAAGDYVEIKGVNPTWATNPSGVAYSGYLYFE